MVMIDSQTAEEEAVMQVAKLMLLSARTAPKSGGVDDIHTLILSGEEMIRVAEEMEKIAEERNIPGFIRDAKNLRSSKCLVLIGVKSTKSFGMNCGGCGYISCEAFDAAAKIKGNDYVGPACIFKVSDFGIALGSAVKTASIHNVDNRIMYRIGTAAKRLGYLGDADIVMGIPLSATGKSIYFDRKS
ncbi:MAG: DUF2148 domain-containing protein [Nitrososphaerales archaeon]